MKDQSSKTKYNEYMRVYYHRPYVKLKVRNRLRKDIRICKMCDKFFNVDKSERGKYCSQNCYWKWLKLNPPDCLEKTNLKIRGRSFKGHINSYNNLHNWVRRNLGEPIFCEKCGSNQRVEWANRSQKYLKELLDWIPLCKHCHFYYDRQFERMYAKGP